MENTEKIKPEAKQTPGEKKATEKTQKPGTRVDTGRPAQDQKANRAEKK
jgi:hypothetical protein